VIAAGPSFVSPVRDEIRNAGVAFPPAFVRAIQLVDDRGEQRRLRRIGDIVNLVTRVAVRTQ
jgi:hypothetical protein